MKNKIIQILIAIILFLIALIVPFKDTIINEIIYFVIEEEGKNL